MNGLPYELTKNEYSIDFEVFIYHYLRFVNLRMSFHLGPNLQKIRDVTVSQLFILKRNVEDSDLA